MHRVKWKLEKLSFFEKGKLSIANSEKCRDEKVFLGVSKFKFKLGESRGKLMYKTYSNYVKNRGNFMHEGVCAASFPLKLENFVKEGKCKKLSLRVDRGKL